MGTVGVLEGSTVLLAELTHELDLAGHALRTERTRLQALSGHPETTPLGKERP